jgi:uroporphyrin-III C-methyltransferase/precorrin-2 dehydrogenase/sirohydrochlorin ferrochelatase
VKHLPVFLDVRGRDCLIVGGGEVAARKAELLLRAGSRLTVLAPELGPTLTRLADAGELSHRAANFSEGDIAGFTLAIAATDDPAVNVAVATAARARGIPVNVVDDPAHCDFILPSVLDRSPLLVAVSTGGATPMLARALRARLETLIPPAYGRLAALLDRFRERLKERLPIAARRRFVEQVIEGPVAELVFAGKDEEAAEMLRQAIEVADPRPPRGEVSLIGAGPGDPDLLTFRALRLMQRADVVLYDRLVSERILDLVRRDAERIYVGKRRNYHALRQEEIIELLVTHARAGRHVVRLKGGDPFVFGRGGEEIATLAEEGIPFQVVPGITAANGCAAYAGIPLTHRDYAHSVLFVTGHRRDGQLDLDWDALARPHQTLALYMGLESVDIICSELQRHGMSPEMPVALIERGTTPAQRVLTGTLRTLPGMVARHEVHAPTLLIVGEVVSLREQLAWFKSERPEQERS